MTKWALQCSGGRDSLALLYYMRPYWGNLTVCWASSGDAYPELGRLMDEIERMVPHFVAVRGHAKRYRAKHGDPTDDNWMRCCYASMWEPMARYVKDEGYTHVFRGVRSTDEYAHLIRPGTVSEGVTYLFPLWDWTSDDVERYLGDRLPAQYYVGHPHSLDCMGCTATAACGGKTKHIWDEVRHGLQRGTGGVGSGSNPAHEERQPRAA